MDTYIQVRTNEKDKQEAAKILEELGTNTSAVVNMLLKQIIITRSIPFEVKLADQNEKQISKYRIEDVKAILKVVPESVEEIWVFGSTVTPYCRPQSDLDICVIGHTSMEDEAKLFKAAKCSVDIITETPEGFAAASLVQGSVYKDVKDKGILIYRKGEDVSWNKI